MDFGDHGNNDDRHVWWAGAVASSFLVTLQIHINNVCTYLPKQELNARRLKLLETYRIDNTLPENVSELPSSYTYMDRGYGFYRLQVLVRTSLTLRNNTQTRPESQTKDLSDYPVLLHYNHVLLDHILLRPLCWIRPSLWRCIQCTFLAVHLLSRGCSTRKVTAPRSVPSKVSSFVPLASLFCSSVFSL